MMSLSDLQNRVSVACDSWMEPQDSAAFWHNWRGTGDGTDPAVPCVALVQYVRTVGCVADDWLTAKLSQLEGHDHESSAAWMFPSFGTKSSKAAASIRSHREQLANLVAGITATVQAAIACRARPRTDSFKALSRAATHYDHAWQLTSVHVPPPGKGADFSRELRSSELLLKAHADGAFSANGITISTWLILARLLDTLFAETEPRPLFANKASMLLYAGNGQGQIGPLRIESSPASQPGVILDPLAFGTTVVDEAMQLSLRIAYRCCRQSVFAQPHGNHQIPAIRLTPELPAGNAVLGGASAGGLFAVAVLATAMRKRLDLRRTATIALRIDSSKLGDDLVPLDAADVKLEKVGEITSKLTEARLRVHNLVEIALHADDVELWRNRFGDNSRPAVRVVSSLPQLLEMMRGDERYEEQLEDHCRAISRQWEQIQQPPIANGDDNASEKDEHRFDCYVWPTYRIEKPQRVVHDPKSEMPTEPESEPVPGEREEALFHLLECLIQERRGLIVYDKAGAGKTVFSWQMQGLLASPAAHERIFERRAPLVVRWHGAWPQADGRPLSLLSALVQELRRTVPGLKDHTACVRYALDQKRVVIILDGFDQFAESEQFLVATMLQPDSTKGDLDARLCHWIVTSRVHAIDAHRATLFDDLRWTQVRINAFSVRQQDAYFKDIGHVWLQTVPNRDAMGDLLELPLVLRMVRRLIEDRNDNEPIPIFCTLSELFLKSSRLLLKRAIEKSRQELQEANQIGMQLKPDEQLTLLDHVLALLAFQMLLDENYNGVIAGDGETLRKAMETYKERAKNRFLHEIDEAVDHGNAGRRQRQKLEQQQDQMGRGFDWAIALLETIELNHRATTEVFKPERVAFRSRKMVECYAARYLTNYATEWDIFGGDDDIPCAFNFTNDPQWKECWKLAIEMPRHANSSFLETSLDPEITCRSLSALFRQPKLEIRPNELIYRAWHLFEMDDLLLRERQFLIDGRLVFGEELSADDRLQFGRELLLPYADVVLKEFRKSSEPLVDEIVRNSAEQRQASDRDHGNWLKNWQHTDSRTKSTTFVQCPPQAFFKDQNEGRRDMHPCVNVMGSTKHESNHESEYDDEKFCCLVRVVSFQMLATPVPRGLYKVFDPAFECSERIDSWGESVCGQIEKYAEPPPDAAGGAAIADNYPVIDTDWYDAWVFSRWLGPEFSLATECQWEHACRAGTYSAYHFGEFLNNNANCRGNFQRHTDENGRNLRRMTFAGDPQFPANAYGLFDMHGNVLEWCHDWYAAGWYATRRKEPNMSVAPEDNGPPVGLSRVLRGGAWDGFAIDCRSARRFSSDPLGRSHLIGFRVVRRLKLDEPS